MARNRTPSNILDLKGAYKKHPDRKRSAEPQAPTFKKTPPRHLSDDERKVWRELVRDIASGVLQQSDRPILEQAVYLLCVVRKAKSTVIPIRGRDGQLINMKMACSASVHQQLTSCLSRLGMTPADRSRVATPQRTTNKFAKLKR